MIETIQADWIKSEAINLENCCNDNPLKILGPHFYQEQWVIRVWMPEADEVKINFKNNIGLGCLKIEDNGTKSKKDSKTGFGLENMKMRAKKLNATIEFYNKDGFTILIKLPFAL